MDYNSIVVCRQRIKYDDIYNVVSEKRSKLYKTFLKLVRVTV